MQTSKTYYRWIALVLSAQLLSSGEPKQALATNIFWDGSANDSWQIVANWHFTGMIQPLPRIPGDFDDVSILEPAGDDIRLLGNTNPVNSLIISNGIELETNGFLLHVDDSGAANTAIAGGARITVDPIGGAAGFNTDNLLLSGFGVLGLNNGRATVGGNTTLFTNSQINGFAGGGITFGGDVTANGSVIRLTNGTTASFRANSTVKAEDTAILDLEQQVNIINGTTFEIESNSRLEVSSLNVGNNGNGVGSVGRLSLDAAAGSAPRVDVALGLTVGHATNGTGLIDMKNGIASIIGKTIVNTTGTIELQDSQLAANGDLLVDGGTITSTDRNNPIFLPVGGKLTARNSGTVAITGDQWIRADGLFEFFSGADLEITGKMTIGTDVGSTGTLTLDGPGTTLDVGGQLLLGDEGQEGRLELSGEAVAEVGGALEVGNDGSGHLSVESGATLSSATGRIGTLADAQAVATIAGVNSRWEVDDFLSIGSSGTGTLSILDGARVSSAVGFIASDSVAVGNVNVGGNGATWTVDNSVVVGGGSLTGVSGDATLQILPGGHVEIGNTLSVRSNDLVRLAGGTLTAGTIELSGGQFQWLSGTLHAETSLDDLVNQNGTLAPGKTSVGQKVGLMTIDGNYTQQAGAALAIDLGGDLPVTEYDQVGTTGFALLDGELQVSLVDSFIPDPSDTFTVLNALGGIAGLFDNVATGARLDVMDGLGSFLVHYGAGSPFADNQIVLSGFLPASADLDSDGDVDGRDFLLIQRTNPALIPLWASQFGSTQNSFSATEAVVPEPASCGLAAVAMLVLIARLPRGVKSVFYVATSLAPNHNAGVVCRQRESPLGFSPCGHVVVGLSLSLSRMI